MPMEGTLLFPSFPTSLPSSIQPQVKTMMTLASPPCLLPTCLRHCFALGGTEQALAGSLRPIVHPTLPQTGLGCLGCSPACTMAWSTCSSCSRASAHHGEYCMGLLSPPSAPVASCCLVNLWVQLPLLPSSLSPLSFEVFLVLWLFLWKNRKLTHSIMFLRLNRRPKSLGLSIQDLTPVLKFRGKEKGDLSSACNCGCPPLHSVFPCLSPSGASPDFSSSLSSQV